VEQVTDRRDALPLRLSPSRAKEFDQCPRRFWFSTIRGCSTPPTAATLKGNLFHTVFEQLFDLERAERTREAAHSLVEPVWTSMTEPATERHALEARAVIPRGSAAEAALLDESRRTVDNYFDEEIERPWNFDPVGRELHLEADVGGLVLHGFIDRLDRYETSAGEERWVISDYKTGKLPRPQYLSEAFFAMRVYALLLAEAEKVTPFSLRLLYVGVKKGVADQREPVDAVSLEATRSRMLSLWRDIETSATEDLWEERTGPLCGWCHFKQFCPAFGGDKEAAPRDWLDVAGATT
jgi:putative RecB family exonuclease